MQSERTPQFPEYKVVVDDVTGGEIANIIRGYIEIKGERIRFKGIAYGRYGGQNFAPRLSPLARRRLREIFGDASKFEEDLQQKMVRGEFAVDAAAAEAAGGKEREKKKKEEEDQHAHHKHA